MLSRRLFFVLCLPLILFALLPAAPVPAAETFDDICKSVESDRPVAVPNGFRDVVLEAAKQARADRQIGLIQYWRIKAAANNPRQLPRIYAGVIDEGIAAGVIDGDASADGFDWDQLLAFIERLIPVILKLIALFG
jgi:hypothetical protein